MIFQIETERLIIRDLLSRDIPVLLSRKIEPAARPNILFQKSEFVYDQKELRTAIAWANCPKQREYYQLAVILKSDDSLIGTCGIWGVYPDNPACIGWHYESKYAGKGYATEAARELLYIGFEMNRAALIYAECFEANLASVRIMQKLGMSPDYSSGDFYNLNGNGEKKPAIRHFIWRQEWMTQHS